MSNIAKAFENVAAVGWFDTPDGIYSNSGQYFEQISDLFVNTNLDLLTEFKTDNSLIYADEQSFFVRGSLEFKVMNTDNMNAVMQLLHVKDITPGIKYRRMMEVQLSGWPGYQSILGYRFL